MIVPAAGAKWWRFDYRFGGKQQTLSLHAYGKPAEGLLDPEAARAEALRLRALIRQGKNPSDISIRKVEKEKMASVRRPESGPTASSEVVASLPFGDVIDQAGRLGREPESFMVDSIYLAALSRHPSAKESSQARHYFENYPDSLQVLQDLFWALLNSNEFVLIH